MSVPRQQRPVDEIRPCITHFTAPLDDSRGQVLLFSFGKKWGVSVATKLGGSAELREGLTAQVELGLGERLRSVHQLYEYLAFPG